MRYLSNWARDTFRTLVSHDLFIYFLCYKPRHVQPSNYPSVHRYSCGTGITAAIWNYDYYTRDCLTELRSVVVSNVIFAYLLVSFRLESGLLTELLCDLFQYPQ